MWISLSQASSFPKGNTHKIDEQGWSAKMIWFFAKKSLDMGPIFQKKKSLDMGLFFPIFLGFEKCWKIDVFLCPNCKKMNTYFQKFPRILVPIFGKIYL